MKIYELSLKIFLLKSIPVKEALEKISELVDKTLSKSPKYLSLHQANSFKYYVFNGFFPLEKNGIYREGKIYTVKIRTIKGDLAEYFMKNLANEYTSSIKALTIDHKIIPKRHIEKLYTITPVVIKTDQGYWKNHLSIEAFEKRVKENLIKKYNTYSDTKLDEEFQLFNMIKMDNHKPISNTYKSVHILGDKITVMVAENEIAQNLAYMSLGSGFGEMNSRGFGFMNYRCL